MKKDNKIVNYISAISSMMLIILSVSLFYSIYKINILSLVMLIILGIVLLIIDSTLILLITNKKRNKYIRYIFTFISIIFIFLYSLGISYSILTARFVNNITKDKSEYQSYYVMASKTSSKKIKDLNSTRVGFLSNNNMLDEVKSELSKSADISFSAIDYDNDVKLIEGYNNKEIEGFVLSKNYVEEIKESGLKTLNDYKKIYEFKIKLKKETPKSEVKDNESFILYISGSDSREGLSTTARSDVNILATVNPKNHKILLVNIPRDYYVTLSGTSSKDKLTHAGIYGIDKSKNTINDLLNININYHVKVGFDTVIKSVDELGGIDIYSDKEFIAYTNRNCKFIEGTQHVNGECALAFSRERYAYESGDRHRGENQEQVLSKMLEKVMSPNILIKYSELLKSLDGSFETDMSYNQITSFVKNELSDLKKYEVETYNLDGTGSSESTYSMGSQKLYVMIPDENTVNTAREKIQEYLK